MGTEADTVEAGRGVANLPERERRVLELRFGLGCQPQPLEAIGKALGISRERVRQVEADALELLGKELGGDEELAEAA